MNDYYSMLVDAAGMFIFLGVELSVLFILISAGVSLLQQYIPDEKIQSLLGGSHGRGYFLAALIGAITPFCTCSTIPMLRGLLKAKAGFGPTLTFLFASPLLNPIIVILFVATFGLQVSIIYTSVALVVSVAAGYILNKMHFERYVLAEGASVDSTCCAAPKKEPTQLKPFAMSSDSCCSQPSAVITEMNIKTHEACCNNEEKVKSNPVEKSSCCTPLQEITSSCCGTHKEANDACCGTHKEASDACCGTHKEASSSCCSSEKTKVGGNVKFKQRLKPAFEDAWGQFKQVFPYLLLGVSLGAMVYGFVPSDFIAQYASGDSVFAVPIAAIIGIPLYVRVEALIPLSAVLVGKGMGLGAVMALIIGGGGASLTEVILLKSMFKTQMIIAFLVVILGMAMAAGYIFQYAL